MRKLNLFGLLLAGMSASALVGCSEDISIADQMNEDYVKSFIEKYGLPGEGNMFNMAKRGQVTVKSSQPVNVEVIAMENGKYYSFAFSQEVFGIKTINFDIPSHIQDIVLYVDGQYYPTKIGATYDLDHPTRSRDGEADVWTDAKLKDVTTQTVPYTNEWNNGILNVNCSGLPGNDTNGYSGLGGSINATGAELKQYVSDKAEDYDKFDNGHGGLSLSYPIFNMAILNVNKPDPTHEYEIGVYYGNQYRMNESDVVTFVPLYRTDEVPEGKSVIVVKGERKSGSQFKAAGVEFVMEFSEIDFKSDEGAINTGKFEYTLTEDFSGGGHSAGFGYHFTRDNKATYGENSLEAKLERHAAAQAKEGYPKLSTLTTNGATDYTGLPVLDENDQWAFYDKFDEYIYNWLEDHSDFRKDVIEYEQFRQMLGAIPRALPAHAVPIVKNEGDHKYRITYYTAYSPSDGIQPAPYINASGESLCNYEDDKIYFCEGVQVGVPGNNTNNPHEFTVYMKDLTDNTVVSVNDGSRVKGTGRYIKSGDVIASNGFGVTMIDFDGDGIYNDFVYRHSVPGGSSTSPSFEPYTWYLACEDLGSSGDCDFNDAVFAIQYITGNSLTTQNINVWPLAAGGIYPIYLMWSDGIKDYMVGKELHSWLGKDERDAEGNLQFINTEEDRFTNNKGATATFNWDIPQHDGRFSIDSYENLRWGEGTIAGFWVLVDKDNVLADIANSNVTFNECDAAAILEKYPQNLWKVNNMPIGNSVIPQMMLVSQEWEWPKETVNINEAYKTWQSWMNSSVGGGTDIKWYGADLDENSVDRDNVVKRWD